jgi:Domain of unknown function (DUF4218)
MAAREHLMIGMKPKNELFFPWHVILYPRKKKNSLLGCLASIKVSIGYSSTRELKLIGMKSHYCHVLLTQLLQVALQGILPSNVRHSITKLCFFFNAICFKVIDPGTLEKLQTDVVVTVCELEMYFPPSFFDIMVHLTVHLVQKIKLCGLILL